MAFWRPVRSKFQDVIATLGDGINDGLPPFQIGDGEATYLRNLDSYKYPAMAVRPGRSTFATVLSGDPNGLGERNNERVHALHGTFWSYWNGSSWVTLTTSLANSDGRIEEFVTGTDRYTIVMNSTQARIWDGTSTAANFGDANTPVTRYFTVHKGRVYAIDNNSGGVAIDFSALNLPNDWTTAEDSGTISITNAKGRGTAIITFADHVVVFTEYSMHELYGTGPDNYELIDVSGEIGCVSDRSLVICNNRLYWMWHDGVYEYAGGMPQRVSSPFVDAEIRSITSNVKPMIAGGSLGDFLYMAIPVNGSESNNLLLKFDTRLRKWFVEEGEFVDFVTVGDALYGFDADGQIWNMRDMSKTGIDGTSTPISWSLITKPFQDGSISGRKTLSELWAVADISTGSTSFTIGYSTNVFNSDSTSFTKLATLSGSSNMQNERILVPTDELQNVNWYRLRLAGTGNATVHFLQKNLRVKPR